MFSGNLVNRILRNKEGNDYETQETFGKKQKNTPEQMGNHTYILHSQSFFIPYFIPGIPFPNYFREV